MALAHTPAATPPPSHPFAVLPLQSPDATTWSAPLFIKLFAGGLGLTMGYSQIDSLIVLDTQEAVQRYSRPHKFDLNMEAAAVGPFNNLAAHDDASVGALGDESFIYSVAKVRRTGQPGQPGTPVLLGQELLACAGRAPDPADRDPVALLSRAGHPCRHQLQGVEVYPG